MQRSSSDLNQLIPRSSSASSWTESESLLRSTDVTDESGLTVTTPTGASAGPSVSFTVGGGGDNFGEDEDGDMTEDMMDQKGLTKKDIHMLNEQRRRDLIKNGYATLSELVPACKQSPSGAKMSRATMLQKTIDYILFLQKQSVKQEEDLERLQREVKALEIMKENYEQIARAHQHTPTHETPQVPDHVKFLVFQSIADQLFQSFNSSISVTSFDTLSSCIISWLEEYCKPQSLRELVVNNLQRVNALSASPPVFTSPLPQQQTAAATHPSTSSLNSEQTLFQRPS